MSRSFSGTAEVQLVAPSGLLQSLQLPVDVPAAEIMRTSLREMGKEAKGAAGLILAFQQNFSGYPEVNERGKPWTSEFVDLPKQLNW